MTETTKPYHTASAQSRALIQVRALAYRLRFWSMKHPLAATGVLLAIGMLAGVGMRSAAGMAQVEAMQAAEITRQAELQQVRRNAQHEVNALAARLAELQAQANRLNALGARLTQAGQLQDGEFDFNKPVGQGGVGRSSNMLPGELRDGLVRLEGQFHHADTQLSVLESLLFNRELDRSAIPSGDPIANSYITSGFGSRADPFGGGHVFHKGIDFEANVGDPVLAVADGVVSFSGVRSGYGKVIEIDHGNGYVTRYAHNSRLERTVGDLVRSGQKIAKAGSTGRSTGAHVHLEVWQNGRVINPRQFLASASQGRRG